MPTAHYAPGSRVSACLLALALSLAVPQIAHAEAEDAAVIDKVTKMNKKAVEEYENLNFEEARKILKEALDICSANGLDKHPVKARTHIHLGVVILAGFKQREMAIKQFRKALEIQPDIKLTKSLANPEVQEVFDEAVKGMGQPEQPPEPPQPPPKEIPEGLNHEPITRATQGRPIPVQATVSESVGAKKVVLGYRAEGMADFLGREMKEITPGTWSAEIPATATGGNKVSYYVDAQSEEGESLDSKGSASEPLSISLRPPAVRRTPGEEEPEEGDHKWLVGVGLGGGIGWATGNGEVNALNKISPPGFAPSSLAHVLVSFGYLYRPKLLLGAQIRYQYVSGPTEAPTMTTECGTDHICSPAKYALAVFARGAYLFGESNFHPYVSAMAGGGYIRHVASFPSAGNPAMRTACGPNGDVECVDTVAAGPVLVGPGGGLIYNVTSAVGLTVGLDTFLGFPNFTFHVDGSAGVAMQF
jgi:hypothetical protein